MKIQSGDQVFSVVWQRFGDQGWRTQVPSHLAGQVARALRFCPDVLDVVVGERHVLILGSPPASLDLSPAQPESRRFCFSVRTPGLDAIEGVDALFGTPLSVLFLGFQPGFAYLTGLPSHLQLPRRSTPRPRVPAGSLGLGGGYAGIYPRDCPGGWSIVGFLDPVPTLFQGTPLLQPGDVVLFERFP